LGLLCVHFAISPMATSRHMGSRGIIMPRIQYSCNSSEGAA
jgi:hypothetical protein